ncbi:hypothetical protein TSMEX_001219 [Taenia solium]|eukprot:TsM_000869700 transcript=TsM_000869700 gene=TsM_000869700
MPCTPALTPAAFPTTQMLVGLGRRANRDYSARLLRRVTNQPPTLTKVELGGERVARREQDSNLRGETPMDFESIALTTRPSRRGRVLTLLPPPIQSARRRRGVVT